MNWVIKANNFIPEVQLTVDSAQHNVDKYHNLNLQTSFVSIGDNEGEENHPLTIYNLLPIVIRSVLLIIALPLETGLKQIK